MTGTCMETGAVVQLRDVGTKIQVGEVVQVRDERASHPVGSTGPGER